MRLGRAPAPPPPPAPPSQGEERGDSSGAAAPPSAEPQGQGGGAALPSPFFLHSPPPRVLPTSAVFPDYATHCGPAAHKAGTAHRGTPSLLPRRVPTCSSPWHLELVSRLDAPLLGPLGPPTGPEDFSLLPLLPPLAPPSSLPGRLLLTGLDPLPVPALPSSIYTASFLTPLGHPAPFGPTLFHIALFPQALTPCRGLPEPQDG